MLAEIDLLGTFSLFFTQQTETTPFIRRPIWKLSREHTVSKILTLDSAISLSTAFVEGN